MGQRARRGAVRVSFEVFFFLFFFASVRFVYCFFSGDSGKRERGRARTREKERREKSWWKNEREFFCFFLFFVNFFFWLLHKLRVVSFFSRSFFLLQNVYQRKSGFTTMHGVERGGAEKWKKEEGEEKEKKREGQMKNSLFFPNLKKFKQ